MMFGIKITYPRSHRCTSVSKTRTRTTVLDSQSSALFYLFIFYTWHCLPRGAKVQKNKLYIKHCITAWLLMPPQVYVISRGQVSKDSLLLCAIPSGLQEEPLFNLFCNWARLIPDILSVAAHLLPQQITWPLGPQNLKYLPPSPL